MDFFMTIYSLFTATNFLQGSGLQTRESLKFWEYFYVICEFHIWWFSSKNKIDVVMSLWIIITMNSFPYQTGTTNLKFTKGSFKTWHMREIDYSLVKVFIVSSLGKMSVNVRLSSIFWFNIKLELNYLDLPIGSGFVFYPFPNGFIIFDYMSLIQIRLICYLVLVYYHQTNSLNRMVLYN